MILNYKFKNFMSFRENVEFSMSAPKSKVKKRFPDNFISVDTGAEVLKTSENQKNYGLFISKLALLGSEHAIRFTEYIKNFLCPETNVINYDIFEYKREFRGSHANFIEEYKLLYC